MILLEKKKREREKGKLTRKLYQIMGNSNERETSRKMNQRLIRFHA
jgi:hypothetical protein